MDREVWQATVRGGGKELDITEVIYQTNKFICISFLDSTYK